MTEDRIRVALADDDVLLREGLASLLERSGFDVVGQCAAAPLLLALVREQRPELVIVDIRMPPGHSTEGLDAARQIRAEFPDIAILVLSAHVEVEHAMGLLSSGQRSGYLLKSRVINVDDFVDTLKRLVRGARWSTRLSSPSWSRPAAPTMCSTCCPPGSARFSR